ncbi:MAG: hypothetical protein K0V04_28865 [Deltaproteobacteria bacterium]|nr:hypothetical protein [Deltaproteobacteria bacterium]
MPDHPRRPTEPLLLFELRRVGHGALAVLLASGVAGCRDEAESAGVSAGSGGDSGTQGGETSTGGDETAADLDVRPNWHQDIAALVTARCVSCHREGGLAFPMSSYEKTAPWATVMAHATADRQMPPWHAVETDECTPPHAFENDARLTDEEIEQIGAWADLGAPEGDPMQAAPLPEPMSAALADPTAVMTMGGAVTIEREGDVLDQFHCLSFDPGTTEDVYLDGMQVVAGNSKVLHHILIFIDESADSASWPSGVLEDCGGGSGAEGATLVGAWLPGAFPIETPDDVGIRLPAGARLVFNVHYHAAVTGPQVDDSTGLALRWSSERPQWISEFGLVGAPGDGASLTGEFLIPAGATGHTETLDWEVPDVGDGDIRIWSIGHHMHKVGVDMKTTVLRGGQEHCLAQTPRWDYGWQRLYEYDMPVDDVFAVEPGDVVRVRCTYDNTLNNPFVVEALSEVGLVEPQDVRLGEGTLDEMCLAGIGVAVRP